MAIEGGGRLCRTRHEPRVDRRVKRDRHPVANPAGSPAIATPSPDAGEKWARALTVSRKLCQVAPHCSAGFLHAGFCLHELGKTAQAKKLLMKGSIVSRHREERSRSQGDPGIDLIGGTVAAATRVRRKCGRHRGRPSMFV